MHDFRFFFYIKHAFLLNPVLEEKRLVPSLIQGIAAYLPTFGCSEEDMPCIAISLNVMCFV